MKFLQLLGFLVIFNLSCSSLGCHKAQSDQKKLKFHAAAVPERHALDVAKQILIKGGNAVDAAIAVGFALAVTLPDAGNIGGGGFMLVHFEGENYFIDYREIAPAKAHRDMYLDAQGNVDSKKSLIGHFACGVPGTVAGLWMAHQKFGALPWAGLIEPAIKLAQDGFVVDEYTEREVKNALGEFKDQTNFSHYFGNVKKGAVFRQPELAETLKRIVIEGPADFYKGRTAELIVDEMKRGNGLISMNDLANYRSKMREPVVGKYRDCTIVSAPPPSSGGVALIQMLTMKEILQDRFANVSHNSFKYVHLVAEIEKRVFADRAYWMGDADYVKIPIDRLISKEYCKSRSLSISLESKTPTADVRHGVFEKENTTHFSIVDRYGNAVSNTYTLNDSFGCGVVVKGAGFLLNNEMDDFSAKPGHPNLYGLVGGEANAIAPGKRMLSSMSPTLVFKKDRLYLIVGTPGGPTIITTNFQIIANVLDFKMDIDKALRAGRFHHQLYPADQIKFEKNYSFNDKVQKKLTDFGYQLVPRSDIGDVQTIIIGEDGSPVPFSDPRGVGKSERF